ncbi:hypothetical protein [Gemmata massiliana]|nr:hypothetical protein [Gemmata massiliana]
MPNRNMLVVTAYAILSAVTSLPCEQRLKQLEGEWVASKVVLRGEDITDEFKRMKWVLRSGVFTVRIGADTIGESRFVSMTLGGRVDLEYSDIYKPGTTSRQFAIYTISANSFKMCASVQPADVQTNGSVVKPEDLKRPTRFGERNTYVIEYKKVK